MSAAETAINNMAAAQAMPLAAPSGTATCPEGRIRIGVFFDGTGNNMYKDQKVDPYKPPKGVDRTVTNVVHLYRVYQESGSVLKKIYHHGVGTDSYKENPKNSADHVADWRGLAFGAGGKARVTWGLLQLGDFFSLGTNDLAKEKLFDTYGFSRGAAISRDFVNSVRTVGIDNKNRKNGFKYRAVGRAVIKEQAYERHTGMIPAFLGIFDTVASFGLGGLQAGNDMAGYNLFVDHTWVKKTVHMAAEDEIRGNFPLSSLFMNPSEKGYQSPAAYKDSLLEIWYPGTHGDIGGGTILAPGEAAKPERTEWMPGPAGFPMPVKYPAEPAKPPLLPDLCKITLRDMHKASVHHHVPLSALSNTQGPGDMEREYAAYDGYRSGQPFKIGGRYIQTYPSAQYRPMFYDQRGKQPSILYLKTHYIADSRWPLDKLFDRKQRTVLYMGPQPKDH